MSSPKILVLRGGSKNHALSILTGANIIGSLPLYGGEPVDVYIDQEGKWYKNGLPGDPLHILSSCDAYIDTVNQKSQEDYHVLAEKLGVMRLLHVHEFPFTLDRETMFRVLAQQGVLIPETVVFRRREVVDHTKTRDVFTKILSPYIVRSVNGEESGIIAHTHKELAEALEVMLQKGDAQVMHYRDAKTRSIVAIPNYRGEELYLTLPLEVQVRKYEKPTKEHRLLPLTYLSNEDKDSIARFVKRVHDGLRPKSLFLLDFITTKRGHMVTGISTSPNILNGGRFLESLATTGTDVAHYALTFYLTSVEKKNSKKA